MSTKQTQVDNPDGPSVSGELEAASGPPSFRRLPWPAQAYLPLVLLAAGAATVAVSRDITTPDWHLFAVAVALCAGCNLLEVFAPGHLSLQANGVFFVWAACLLPAWAVVPLAICCFVPGWFVHRFRWYMVSFNTANYLLAGLAVHAAAAGAVSTDWQATAVVRLGLGALAFVVVNHALLLGALRTAHGTTLRAGVVGAASVIPVDLALALMGTCLAVLWAAQPALALLAVGPLLLGYRALWVPLLRHKSRTDPKTNLYNSEHLGRELGDAVARAVRDGGRVGVIMLDLDHLRIVNNRCGHLAGDRLIRSVAEVLRKTAEARGIAARFGGEEFCLLLPGYGLDETRVVAERVRAESERIRLREDDAEGELRVTVSVGVAAYPDHGDTPEALLDAADSAVYDAKLGGRNRVRIALPLGARHALGAAEPLSELPHPGARAASERAIRDLVTGSAHSDADAAVWTWPADPPVQPEDAHALEHHGLLAAWRERVAKLAPHLDRSRNSVDDIRRSRDALAEANTRLRELLDANERLLSRMHRSYLQTITSLARTIEAKDPYTGGHTERVSRFAVAIARELGFDHTRLTAVEVGAVVHDIGKVGVPDGILLKEGPLDESEAAVMRRHPEISSYILSELDLPATVKQMVRSHHERYDGSGYPDGLVGEEIPLSARILAVADALDAMASDRPYRAGRPVDDAVEEIRRMSGIHFCPKVVAALERCLDEIAETPEEPARPISNEYAVVVQ